MKYTYNERHEIILKEFTRLGKKDLLVLLANSRAVLQSGAKHADKIQHDLIFVFLSEYVHRVLDQCYLNIFEACDSFRRLKGDRDFKFSARIQEAIDMRNKLVTHRLENRGDSRQIELLESPDNLKLLDLVNKVESVIKELDTLIKKENIGDLTTGFASMAPGVIDERELDKLLLCLYE